MIRIDVLSDDVLLEIFDFYMNINLLRGDKTKIEARAWQLLVHVCRRWRSVVFGSPRRLNLQLYCTPNTPARDTLDVWPALPLLIRGYMTSSSVADDIIAVLGQSNRVREVHLSGLADRQLEYVLAAMQVPFSELTWLSLDSDGETPPVVPDSFLGGSAPLLRLFQLDNIPFPGLPKLLLSATHLVHLYLYNIPHSGYFSPEAMASLLSVLSSLKRLVLHFQSPQSRPDRESRRPPPSRRSVVPALTRFDFKGATEYLEDVVTYIDAPQLDHLLISFFDQTDFDSPRLAQFISHTPILADCDAHVDFHDSAASVALRSRSEVVEIEISCSEPDWQLPSVAQVCNACLPPLSMIEHLFIRYHSELGYDDSEDTLWLELLLPFPAVTNLYLSEGSAPGILAALQEMVGAEVLPSLQNIFVEGLEPPDQEGIEEFVTTRQLSGHPIAVILWDGYSKSM